MTPERVALAGLFFSFFGKVIADWRRERSRVAVRKARAEAAEAARVEARDRTRRENEVWLRGKVDQMLDAERAEHAAAIAERDSRIAALEADVRMLATMFARGVDRTPTQLEWAQLHAIFARHNIHPNTHTDPAE